MAEQKNAPNLPALPADLPENWTYGQTVSPNGTEAGLTPKHGYNYLMQQVNQAQAILNQVTAILKEQGAEMATKDYVTEQANLKVSKAGDTMTGPLLLPGNPTANLQAAPKQYVDTAVQPKANQADLNAHVDNKSNPHGVTAAQAGAVPTTRKVNNKALSEDITLTAADVGALATAGGTITGNLTLKNGTNYGCKLNFGDGDYVHLSEPTDDCLEIKAKKINFVLSDTTAENFTKNGQAAIKTFTATLSTSWSGSGPYSQTVTVSGLLAADNPMVDAVLSDTAATAKAQRDAWALVDRITTAANSITAYAYDKKPTTAIPIQIKVMR